MTEAAPEWPRQSITFLLTDIESSSRLWEQYPAQMRAALARHDALIEQVVGDHHGIVVRPRGEGDSRFAVFSHPADAVDAACTTQLAFQTEPWDLPEPLRVRMALHTGEADLRAGDYYGNAVNRCARLRNLAYGGQILCSGVTASLTSDSLPAEVSLRRLGIYRLRDLTEPEAVFQLIHPTLRSEFPPLDERHPNVPVVANFVPAYPFPAPNLVVGRESELKALSWVLARGQAGQQTLFVGATAGGGKSTLVGAVARRAMQAGVLVLAGGCYESEAVVPLRPFRDALGDYLLSRPADEIMAELGDVAVDLAEIVPELRHHLGLPPEPPAAHAIDQARLFGAIHSCVRVLAQSTPVLLCLEDLHLADAPTLSLLQYLVQQLHRMPVTVIGTFRSEEVRSGQPLAQLIARVMRDGAEQLDLAPLNREDTSHLIAILLNGPTNQELGDSLYSATEGNPFFIEQLVFTLRAEHKLQYSEGVWRSAGDTRATVPDMVRELVIRRLDRLSTRCSSTLAMAAVLGRSVEHATLINALHPQTEAEVLDDLEEALGARMLQEAGAGYAFGHALVRESVYWNISAPRRLRLHLTAAQTIERMTRGRAVDHAAELAHHYAHAGHESYVRKRALRYSVEAGRRAAAMSSHGAALTHFTYASDLIQSGQLDADSAIRLRVLQGRAEAERNLGHWTQSIERFHQVLALATEPLQRAHAHGAIGRALQQMGSTTAALQEYASGLGQLRDLAGANAVAETLRLRFDQAFCFLPRGRFRDVLRLGQEMLRAAEPLGDAGLAYRAHSVVALAHMHQGQFGDAFAHHQAALGAAQASGDKLFLAVGRENLGTQFYVSGQLDAAQRELMQAIGLYRSSVSDRRAVLALQVLSRVYLASGEIAAAATTIEQARVLAIDAHDRWIAQCNNALGTVHRLQGRCDAAEACFSEALTGYESAGHAVGCVESLLNLALVRDQRGDLSGAGQLCVRAANAAASIDPGPLVVAVRRQLGLNMLRSGDVSGAAKYLEPCLNLARTMPASLEFAPTLLAVAELRFVNGDARALPAAHTALSVAKTLEATTLAHVFLAHAYAQLGLRDAANEHRRQARGLAAGAHRLWLVDLIESTQPA